LSELDDREKEQLSALLRLFCEDVKNRRVEQVAFLIAKLGVDFLVEQVGAKALYLAAAHDDEVLALLLGNGFPIDTQTNEQGTALHLAAEVGDCLAVQRLMRFGAVLSLRSGLGMTALQIATAKGFDACAKQLLC
jgi:ankyrin repeat protein